jgi:hypothetical protein
MRAALTVLGCFLFLFAVYLGLTGELFTGPVLGALGLLTLVAAIGKPKLLDGFQRRNR